MVGPDAYRHQCRGEATRRGRRAGSRRCRRGDRGKSARRRTAALDALPPYDRRAATVPPAEVLNVWLLEQGHAQEHNGILTAVTPQQNRLDRCASRRHPAWRRQPQPRSTARCPRRSWLHRRQRSHPRRPLSCHPTLRPRHVHRALITAALAMGRWSTFQRRSCGALDAKTQASGR